MTACHCVLCTGSTAVVLWKLYELRISDQVLCSFLCFTVWSCVWEYNGNIQIGPPTVTACHCVLCTGSTAVVLWKPPPPSGSILPDLVIFVFFNHLYFTNRLYTLITCQVSSALRNSEQRAPGCGRHRTRCYSEVSFMRNGLNVGTKYFLIIIF